MKAELLFSNKFKILFKHSEITKCFKENYALHTFNPSCLKFTCQLTTLNYFPDNPNCFHNN